eukprot:scaffold4143_cov150-Skeletonema_marinoi.AAC.2
MAMTMDNKQCSEIHLLRQKRRRMVEVSSFGVAIPSAPARDDDEGGVVFISYPVLERHHVRVDVDLSEVARSVVPLVLYACSNLSTLICPHPAIK